MKNAGQGLEEPGREGRLGTRSGPGQEPGRGPGVHVWPGGQPAAASRMYAFPSPAEEGGQRGRLGGPVIRYDVGGLRGLWTPSLDWGQGRGRASWLVQPRHGWRADGGCSGQ